MSGPEQVLYLVIVPAAIVAIVWGLASIGGPQAKRRYRPGRPYEFIPVWYLANHRHGPGAADRPALPPGTSAKSVASAAARSAVLRSGPGQGAAEAVQGSTGGASDRW